MKLTDPIFTDADKAREWFEAQRWPGGRVCPHCGNSDQAKITLLEPKPRTKYEASKATEAHGQPYRPGLYRCAECTGQFSVRVGTVMERSHIALNLWALAMFLMASSKKSMSTRQMARMMSVPLKTAWFLGHRIREAMKEDDAGPLGGYNKVVESDETTFGGKAKNRAYKPEPKKQFVQTLIERDGKARSFHVANVTARTLRETLVKTTSRKSFLMTDEAPAYIKLGREFSGHGTVNHSANEYARLGGFYHVNTTECFFSLCKRAVFGAHHSVSEAHLQRYLTEWDYKFNTRALTDGERTAQIARQAEGKRLMYQRPVQAAHI